MSWRTCWRNWDDTLEVRVVDVGEVGIGVEVEVGCGVEVGRGVDVEVGIAEEVGVEIKVEEGGAMVGLTVGVKVPIVCLI